MRAPWRRSIFAIPFGCLVAIATHFVRFGDDHDFGGSAHGTLVALAVGGTCAVGMTILHAFLTSGSTTTTGSLAAVRVRGLLPGAPALFCLATVIYYAIELLEGNGIELGLPTLVLAVLALLVARALRRCVAIIAAFVAELLREWLSSIARGGRRTPHRFNDPPSPRSGVKPAARRLGRPPPNGRIALAFAR